MRATLCSLVLTALLVQGLPPSARAALGGNSDSVEADRASMRAEAHAGTNSASQTRVLELPSGTTVTEYLASNGVVYAVSWHGPSLPDLHQLLGNYFVHYQSASQQPVVRHRVVRVSNSDIVIESNGKMRAFVGRAWVPALLPNGVTPTDIQ